MSLDYYVPPYPNKAYLFIWHEGPIWDGGASIDQNIIKNLFASS